MASTLPQITWPASGRVALCLQSLALDINSAALRPEQVFPRQTGGGRASQAREAVGMARNEAGGASSLPGPSSCLQRPLTHPEPTQGQPLPAAAWLENLILLVSKHSWSLPKVFG